MAPALQHITGNTYYISGAVNIGIVVTGSDCLVIDTGLDRQAGKQIVRILDQENLKARAIINTHSHADHFGGNGAVFEQAGAKIYASAIEKAVIENPLLEPFYLFSAAPLQDMMTRFLMAPASHVDHILNPGRHQVVDMNVEILSLAGHSPGQIGVITADDVCFCADAYFGEHILDKYGMPYTADVAGALETLSLLAQSSHRYYVPCHGEVSGNPAGTVRKNIAVMEQTLQLILEILSKPLTREEVLAAVMTNSGRKLDAVQYALNHSTVSACLSHLHKSKLADYCFANGKMLWSATSQSYS